VRCSDNRVEQKGLLTFFLRSRDWSRMRSGALPGPPYKLQYGVGGMSAVSTLLRATCWNRCHRERVGFGVGRS
jgi:hypothetical protein